MKYLITLLGVLFISSLNAQDSIYKSIEVGIRTKKNTGFYWENGITSEFYSAKITGHIPLHFGVNLTFTDLGSAFHSNALSMTHFDVYAAYYFRKHKKLMPTVRLNVGYVRTNVGDYFESQNYHNTAMVLGFEAGISHQLPYNLRVIATGGMNLFVGNETKSLGSSVYPVFGQISLLYSLRKIYR